MKTYVISSEHHSQQICYSNRLIEKKLNAIYLLGQYRAHGQLKLVVFVIATITRSAICPSVFSNSPLASLSKWLCSSGCYSATRPLKCLI